MKTEVKDLAYYKTNAEEDYLQVPISVLRYISQLEQRKGYSDEDMNDYANYRLLFKKPIEPKEWFKEFKNK